MILNILGTESLGVRGLSCSLELKSRKIFIDPGIALGWSRYGFLPHPFQIGVGAGIREKIIDELKDATDVIFSHFDGDHCPLNGSQLLKIGTRTIRRGKSILTMISSMGGMLSLTKGRLNLVSGLILARSRHLRSKGN